MAYTPTGLQTMFPVYLARMSASGVRREEYDIAVAQNETNLNQNLESLYRKLLDIEDYLASEGGTGSGSTE